MNATVGRRRVPIYISPVYQRHRYRQGYGTGYHVQTTPYIQPHQVKQESRDDFIPGTIKLRRKNITKHNFVAARIKTWFQDRNKPNKDVDGSSNSLSEPTTITETLQFPTFPQSDCLVAHLGHPDNMHLTKCVTPEIPKSNSSNSAAAQPDIISSFTGKKLQRRSLEGSFDAIMPTAASRSNVIHRCKI